MPRIKKEMAIDLGEPLPLPYKTSKPILSLVQTAHKLEDEDETAVETKTFRHQRKVSDNIRKPIRLETGRTTSKANDELRDRLLMRSQEHFDSNEKITPVSRTVTSIRRDLLDIERLLKTEREQSLSSLQLAKLELELVLSVLKKKEIEKEEDEKNDVESIQDSNGDEQQLKGPLGQEASAERSTEVFEALERLQKGSVQKSRNKNSHKFSIELDYQYLFVAAVILVVFLISSFVVSELSYEYCYYFC